jgi:hypothetical protein
MKQVFGSILLAVGILIAGGSGLCSLVFLGSGITNGFGGMLDALPIFGGIPFAIGLGLFFTGRALVRQAKLETTEKAPANVQQRTTPTAAAKAPEPPASPDVS